MNPTDNDQDQFEDVRRLIALKRYETPGDAYFEQFLSEFQDRQRQEMLKTDAISLLMERFHTWLSGVDRGWGMAAAGATCAAVIMSVVLVGAQNTGDEVGLQAQADVEMPAENSLLREF